MRILFLILATLALAQCASTGDSGPRVSESERARVIIGVAKSADGQEARYALLWRQLDPSGAFASYDGRTVFEVQTNQGHTVRVQGIPGEFELLQVDPGVYALDSVFGVIRTNRVDYVAEGVVAGPERPTFEVRAGEAIYLGIWEASIEEARAVVRPWRLDQADLRAVLRNSDWAVGEVRVRETHTRSVACEPRQLNPRSRRQVC